MKPNLSKQKNQGLTLLELLVILFVLFLLGAMLFPRFNNGPSRAPRIACVNNLKQIGLAYRIWAGDNNDKYPMQTSITNGGVKELFETGSPFSRFVCLNYLVMSNELSTPKILWCPADTDATMATNFSYPYNDANVSYFASPDADQPLPESILSGDANLQVGEMPANSGLLSLTTNTPIAWTEKRHRKAGNIGLADGSAQQVTSSGLQHALQQTGTNLTRLAIP